MSKRKKNILFSLISLVVGSFLYVLFRENTYIGRVFDSIDLIEYIRQISVIYASDLYKFYLPDFLWGFALGCGLIAIYDPSAKGVVICAGVSFFLGCMWEILQYVGILSGTGDVHDIIMYLLASTICIIINVKEIREK